MMCISLPGNSCKANFPRNKQNNRDIFTKQTIFFAPFFRPSVCIFFFHISLRSPLNWREEITHKTYRHVFTKYKRTNSYASRILSFLSFHYFFLPLFFFQRKLHKNSETIWKRIRDLILQKPF